MIRKVLIALFATAASADRGAMDMDALFKADISEHVALPDYKTGDPRKPLHDQLISFKTLLMTGCEDCATVFGALFDGVNQMGLLASVDISTGNTITVTLNAPYIYGETPGKSRLPVLLMLEQTVKLTFVQDPNTKATHVIAEGMHTKTPVQGMKLYEAYIQQCGDGKSCGPSCEVSEGLPPKPWHKDDVPEKKQADAVRDFLLGCIKDEEEASGRYLREAWGKPSFFNGKITSILDSVYGSYAKRKGIEIFASWPQIFYSLTTPCPLTLTEFVFESSTASDAQTTQVYVKSVPYTGTDESRITEKCNRYGLYAKSKRFGFANLLSDGAWKIAQAKTKAASGMTFAMMMAFGDDAIKGVLGSSVSAGEPGKLAALWTLCQKKNSKDQLDEHDPKCEGGTLFSSGDTGRIAWSRTVGELFL